MKPSEAFKRGRKVSPPMSEGPLVDRWIEKETGEIVTRSSHIGAMAIGYLGLTDLDVLRTRDPELGGLAWWWPAEWADLKTVKMPCDCGPPYNDRTWGLDIVLMHMGQMHHPASVRCRLDLPTWPDRKVFDFLRSAGL